MKIIGGYLKNRNFYMPADIRPTPNIVRKAVFDILGQDMSGMTLVDLFAGSGAVGFEALSRGATHVTLVEKESICVDTIRENRKVFQAVLDEHPDQKLELIEADAFATIKDLARHNRRFDIVFVDPPYDLGLARKSLKTLEAYDIFSPSSMLVAQCESRETLPAEFGRFSIYKKKTYGRTQVVVYQSV